MAKGKKSGGRAKGTPNKATAKREAEIAASGLTPLDYMLEILRNPNATTARRDWAASAAAPYVHPKFASVAHSGPGGGAIQVEDNSSPRDLARRIALALAMGVEQAQN